jgi:hypothetical protein
MMQTARTWALQLRHTLFIATCSGSLLVRLQLYFTKFLLRVYKRMEYVVFIDTYSSMGGLMKAEKAFNPSNMRLPAAGIQRCNLCPGDYLCSDL